MAQPFEWTKDTWSASLSSRCWCFTPYEEGWRGSGRTGEDPASDRELAEITAMEFDLRSLPEWVREVVEGPINWVGFCGHYRFPLSFLDAVDAIGSGKAPVLNHTCYTVDADRKRRLSDYALCLDAWLAGARPESAAGQLVVRSQARIDWPAVCRDLWNVIGERTPVKAMLVERLLHRTRWWLAATVWDDDDGTGWVRDAYVGDWRDRDGLVADNGNPRFRPGGFDETASHRVRELEKRLQAACPHWHWFKTVIVEFSWPCAPKAFRFLEKTLWCIGKERPVINLPSFPLENPEPVPDFLQCRDTCPDQEAAGRWWKAFLEGLNDWWRDKSMSSDLSKDLARRLGEPTAVKRWLVRLLVRRLEVLADGHLKAMVDPPADSWRGSKPVDGY